MSLHSTKITYIEDPKVGKITFFESITWDTEPDWIYAQVIDVDDEDIVAAVLVQDHPIHKYFEPRRFKNDIIFSQMNIQPGVFFRIGQQTTRGSQRTLFENVKSTPELIEKFSNHGFSKNNCD